MQQICHLNSNDLISLCHSDLLQSSSRYKNNLSRLFSQGQPHVACTRIGAPNNLFILTPTARSKNVYLEPKDHCLGVGSTRIFFQQHFSCLNIVSNIFFSFVMFLKQKCFLYYYFWSNFLLDNVWYTHLIWIIMF